MYDDEMESYREQIQDLSQELGEKDNIINNIIVSLRELIDDYDRSFDLRWKADMRAIKKWQEAHPGNDNIWPDHADLCVWLMKEYEKIKWERNDLAFRLETEQMLHSLNIEAKNFHYNNAVLLAIHLRECVGDYHAEITDEQKKAAQYYL